MIDVILVGAGARGGGRITNWPLCGGRVVAVVERDAGRAEAARGQGIRSFDSLGEALTAFPDAQLVDICTPPATHKDLVLEALRADRHVLCEKPFVRDEAETQEIAEAARASRANVIVSHNYLGHRPILELRQRVRSGKLGAVFSAHCVWLENHERDTQGIRDPEHWVHQLPGGRLEETLPHIIYTLVNLLDDTSLRVTCANFSKQTSYPWVKADTVSALLSGEKSNASIYLTFGPNRDHVTFMAVGDRDVAEANLHLGLAERRGLRWMHHRRELLERLELYLSSAARFTVMSARMIVGRLMAGGRLRNRLRRDWLLSEVARSIEEGTPPPVSLEEAIATVRITREICAGYPGAQI